MNRGRQRSFSIGGYTVVETLIFLAVSSFIFISAVVLINGRQARAEFQSGVRNFESQLLDMANDVATGYYRSTGTTKKCDASGYFTGGDVPLGMNENCIFIGTVIKLGSGGAAGNEEFVQLTMAGLRKQGDDNVASLSQAQPKVLDSGSGFESKPIGAGMRVACVGVGSDTCTPGDMQNASIGFFTTFEGSTLSGDGGGAVQADLISYPTTLISESANSAATKINATNYASPTLNPRVTICLLGGSNQYALMHLGGSSSGLAVTSEIKEGASCA
jgi:hypothetical protein